jgi:hypothetical protein
MRAVLYNQGATAAMSAGGPIPSPTNPKSQAPISKETSIFKFQNRAGQSAFRKKFTRRGGAMLKGGSAAPRAMLQSERLRRHSYSIEHRPARSIRSITQKVGTHRRGLRVLCPGSSIQHPASSPPMDGLAVACIQHPEKLQISIFKSRTHRGSCLGAWLLEFPWNLQFGIWSLPPAGLLCSCALVVEP